MFTFQRVFPKLESKFKLHEGENLLVLFIVINPQCLSHYRRLVNICRISEKYTEIAIQ